MDQYIGILSEPIRACARIVNIPLAATTRSLTDLIEHRKFILYERNKFTSKDTCTNFIFRCPLPLIFSVLSSDLYAIYLKVLHAEAHQLPSLIICIDSLASI